MPFVQHSRNRSQLFGLCLGFAAFSFGLPALAQPAPTTEFENIIKQANQAASMNKDTEAISLWKQAFSVSPEAFVACNIGHAEIRLHHFADAARWFTTCKRTISPPTTEDGMQRRARALAELEIAKIYLIELFIDADDGASVFVDNNNEGVAPLRFPVFLVPGKHAVEARTQNENGDQVIKREIDGERAQTLKVSVTSPPFTEPAPIIQSPPAPLVSAIRPTPPPSMEQPDQRSTWQRARPWVALGSFVLSGAALGTGLMLRESVKDARAREKEHFIDAGVAALNNDAQGIERSTTAALSEDGHAATLSNLMLASYILSGVFGAAGITAIALPGSPNRKKEISVSVRFVW